MNHTIKIVTGIIFTVAGIGLCITAALVSGWILIYGVPWVIIGIAILLNKKEDEIEGRKDLNKSEAKK